MQVGVSYYTHLLAQVCMCVHAYLCTHVPPVQVRTSCIPLSSAILLHFFKTASEKVSKMSCTNTTGQISEHENGTEQIVRQYYEEAFWQVFIAKKEEKHTHTHTQTAETHSPMGLQENDFPIKLVLLDTNTSLFVPSRRLPEVLHTPFVTCVGVFT